MPIPSHPNHSRAPNTKPEPSDPLASQQRTPEHSDSLASSQHISNPTLLQPFLFLMSSRFLTSIHIPDPTPFNLHSSASSLFPTSILIPNPTPFDLHSSASKSIPDISSVSQLWSGETQSRTSLPRCILVCLPSPSIYLYVPYVSSLVTLRLFPPSHPQFPASINPCLIYLYSISPSTLFSYPVHSLRPIPNRSDHPNHYHTPHLYKYTKYKLL